MNRKDKNRILRRRFLGGAGATSGALMLQALATGIPARVLLDPLSASANDNPEGRILILASSRNGDPINCNVPGTYPGGVTHANATDITNIDHSDDALMAETPLTLDGHTTTAAKLWADLPQSTLDQTLFLHHQTETPVHGDMARVQRMMDSTEKNDMLISLIAKETAIMLGTTQNVPLSLGATSSGELLSSEGRLLANVSPLAVKQSLVETGVLKYLTQIRDKQVDKMYELYRQHGTRAQRELIDSWIKSKNDVRSISESLTAALEGITGNDEANQAKTAVVLAAMKIAPVISIHVNFGGDNHNDAALTNEVDRHVSGLQTYQLLIDTIAQLRGASQLDHGVVFGTLNVFGRNLVRNSTGGRDHNRNHHCMVLMGDGVKAGVIGGLKKTNSKFQAMGINSTTGEADDMGDIPFEETLGAAGKTLGALLGVGEARLDKMIPKGKIIQAALKA